MTLPGSLMDRWGCGEVGSAGCRDPTILLDAPGVSAPRGRSTPREHRSSGASRRGDLAARAPAPRRASRRRSPDRARPARPEFESTVIGWASTSARMIARAGARAVSHELAQRVDPGRVHRRHVAHPHDEHARLVADLAEHVPEALGRAEEERAVDLVEHDALRQLTRERRQPSSSVVAIRAVGELARDHRARWSPPPCDA